MSRKYLIFSIIMFLLFVFNQKIFAAEVVFGPDGKVIRNTKPKTYKKVHNKRRVKLYKKKIIKHIRSVPYKDFENKNKITDPEAEAAAAAGYRIGQTVKIVGKTIYKLAKDSETGSYILIGHGIGGRTFRKKNTRHKEKIYKTHEKINKPEYSSEDYSKNLIDGFSLAFTHKYIKIDTVISKRLVKISGGSIYTEDNTVKDVENVFYTEMNSDMLKLNYCFNDFINAYINLGVSHSEFSDFNSLFGGGFDVNLYQTPDFSIVSLYVDFSGEYLGGNYSENYKSQDGENYSKDTSLSTIDAKIQVGVRFSKVDLYAGILYSLYSEDTERTPETSNTGYDSIKDALDSQDNIGISAGIKVKPYKTFNLFIDGEALCRNSISLTCEYLF